MVDGKVEPESVFKSRALGEVGQIPGDAAQELSKERVVVQQGYRDICGDCPPVWCHDRHLSIPRSKFKLTEMCN